MRFTLKSGLQRKIILEMIEIAGSERSLAKYLNVSNGAIYRLKNENVTLSETMLQKIKSLLPMTALEYKQILPDTWGQSKGGRNLIIKKKQSGTYPADMNRLHEASSKWARKWHQKMRATNPEAYFISQYERFKKIGGYKYRLLNGIPVRNRLEKQIGDYFCSNNIHFEYEPYLNVTGDAYFPDFICGSTIIEATEWNRPNPEKIDRLNKKIAAYKKAGLRVCFFIPENTRKFYKRLRSPVVSTVNELRSFLPS